MNNMYSDVSARVFSIILVIGIAISTLLVLANGENFEDNKTIKFSYNNLIETNKLIKIIDDELIIEGGITNKNIVEGFNLNFNQNINFNSIKKYNLSIIIEFENLNDKGQNEFYLGFSDYSQVVHDKNYFEFKIEDEKGSFIHRGDKLQTKLVGNCKTKCELKITYIIDNVKNNITLNTKFNELKEILSVNLNEEYNKGFNPNNFWLTVPKTEIGNFKIKKLEINY